MATIYVFVPLRKDDTDIWGRWRKEAFSLGRIPMAGDYIDVSLDGDEGWRRVELVVLCEPGADVEAEIYTGPVEDHLELQQRVHRSP